MVTVVCEKKERGVFEWAGHRFGRTRGRFTEEEGQEK
jgi:hypothetical protein